MFDNKVIKRRVLFCSSDFVEVSDNSQSVNWKFCGKTSPFAVTVSQSPVTVHLYSDNGMEETGFQARYLVVKDAINLGEQSKRMI